MHQSEHQEHNSGDEEKLNNFICVMNYVWGFKRFISCRTSRL